MIKDGVCKRQRKNPNDPARFVLQSSVTKNGEVAKKKVFQLDVEKIGDEAKYDGLYAVCTDLLDDEVQDILKVSEGRWQIEACFRMLKTDFQARPIYVRTEDSI